MLADALGLSFSADLDSRILLQHIMHWDEINLISRTNWRISEHQFCQYRTLIHNRACGQPIAYLTGQKEFWSLPMLVDCRVLIPRPETELLVEQVLALTLELVSEVDSVDILELGTGSGAISLALGSEIGTHLVSASITATDVSADSLNVARRNHEILGQNLLGLKNINWKQSDWFAEIKGKFNVICSNPPYISDGDPHLSMDGVRYEPTLALVSAPNGLACLQHIVSHSVGYLQERGWLVLEHGYDQAQAVQKMMQHAGFKKIESRQDLNANPRITWACLP